MLLKQRNVCVTMNVMVMEVEERKRNGHCEIELNANGPKGRWQGTVDMFFGGVGTCSRSNYGPFPDGNHQICKK